jgi:Probable zinc-ribbon domain
MSDNSQQQPEIDDILCECVDCRKTFVFEAGEVQFFRSKGLAWPPKRCPACRKLRKATINKPFANADGETDGNR